LLLNVVFGVNIIFIKLDYSRSGIIWDYFFDIL
jgi:hypothetical protein